MTTLKTQIHNLFCALIGTGLLAMPVVVQAQLSYADNGNGTATITGYNGGGAVVIPGMTNGLTVTSIAYGAFQSSTLTSVTIPGSVTSIGDNAFYFCTSLTSVTISNGVTS